MNKELETPVQSKLKEMIGGTFFHKGKKFTIQHIDMKAHDCVEVFIDNNNGEPMTITNPAAFIERCVPCSPDSDETGISTEVAEQTNGLLSSLQQTLLDNIEAVKKDGSYIKQANTINSSVNSLIGLAKIQLSLAKMKTGR